MANQIAKKAMVIGIDSPIASVFKGPVCSWGGGVRLWQWDLEVDLHGIPASNEIQILIARLPVGESSSTTFGIRISNAYFCFCYLFLIDLDQLPLVLRRSSLRGHEVPEAV